MTQAKFEKISRFDKSLYGSCKLLLCGFSGKAQSKFMTVLKVLGLETIPTVWATSEQDDTRLWICWNYPIKSAGVNHQIYRGPLLSQASPQKNYTD